MALKRTIAEPPDHDLISRAQGGEREAFGMLAARHYDFVFRVAWRWAGNRSEAEDIAQEVFARLAKALNNFRGASAFTTWLYALTMNVARDLARKRKSEHVKAEAWHTHALIMGEAEDEPGDDLAAKMWAAVRKLPDKQRESVVLIYGEGLSHSAAADVLGCAEATVSWHIHEAKKRLKVLMAEDE